MRRERAPLRRVEAALDVRGQEAGVVRARERIFCSVHARVLDSPPRFPFHGRAPEQPAEVQLQAPEVEAGPQRLGRRAAPAAGRANRSPRGALPACAGASG